MKIVVFFGSINLLGISVLVVVLGALVKPVHFDLASLKAAKDLAEGDAGVPGRAVPQQAE